MIVLVVVVVVKLERDCDDDLAAASIYTRQQLMILTNALYLEDSVSLGIFANSLSTLFQTENH